MDKIPLSWARDVLNFTITQVSTSPRAFNIAKEPNLTDPKDPGKDPRFRKLVEAILFSRKFVQTYNLVLFWILLVFTIWHWAEKIALVRRRRRTRVRGETKADAAPDPREDEGWSSSSSTVEGASTPPDAAKRKANVVDETSPLLAAGPLKRRSLGLRKAYYVLKSWLRYQPAPIPIINKTIPPNHVSLLILAFLALNVFYNFYRMPLSFQYAFVFADRCGILFSANLPLLYLLAAKNQPIKFMTGYSYESLNILHRRVGELLCFEALLHFVGMLFVWYGLLRHLGFTLFHFLFNRVVGLGLGAFVSYEALYFTSLGSFRQRWYEIFLASHIFFHIAGLALLFFHHPTSRLYVGISLAIFLIDRLVFRFWLKSSTHSATLSVLEDDETLLLSANWDTTERHNALVPRSMRNGWKPNDHIFLTIPALHNKYIIQSHPFTIFSAAPSASADDAKSQHAWFSLLIRAQADSGFTSTLLNYARSHPNTRIRLDGPYGSSHALDILSDSENAIVVAGGSGIAVAYPLLWALLCPSSDSEAAITRRNRKIKLLWVIHSDSHRSWVSRTFPVQQYPLSKRHDGTTIPLLCPPAANSCESHQASQTLTAPFPTPS
jgi:hypothetical protein